MRTWQDLVTASLIGTERAVVPPAGTTGLLPAEDATGDPAAVLLDRAALLTAARRAGRRPDRAELPPVCEPDPRPTVSPAAAARLTLMLGGEHRTLLLEWLRAVTARGLRLPPQSLPTLLDRARRTEHPVLARLVSEGGGPRARWLAGLNPDWEFVLAETPAGDQVWRLGHAAQRRGYLTWLLARDPDAARELVRDGWDAAGPAERVMFLSVLAEGLGPADEPLLEAALDDRSEDVRSQAARLLHRLTGSAFGQRMAGRALRCARIEYSARGTRLVITLPARADASMRRDGITPVPMAGRGQPQRDLSGPGRLLFDVVAGTPLRTWTSAFGLTARQIVAVPSGDWAPVLFDGWTRAAVAQHDDDWKTTLIVRAITDHPPGRAGETALRLLASQADPALGAPGALPEPGPDAAPVVGAALDVLRFRYEMLKELDHDHSA